MLLAPCSFRCEAPSRLARMDCRSLEAAQDGEYRLLAVVRQTVSGSWSRTEMCNNGMYSISPPGGFSDISAPDILQTTHF